MRAMPACQTPVILLPPLWPRQARAPWPPLLSCPRTRTARATARRSLALAVCTHASARSTPAPAPRFARESREERPTRDRCDGGARRGSRSSRAYLRLHFRARGERRRGP
uniref:Uncharacterized protein n=1 Tax=Zea mays TaxID=4577 RepID=A0A804Q2Q2_MAIZE